MVELVPFQLALEDGWSVEIGDQKGIVVARIRLETLKEFESYGFNLPTDFCPGGENLSLLPKNIWIISEIRKDLLRALKLAKQVYEGGLIEPWKKQEN